MATSKWDGPDGAISLGWTQARTVATPMSKNTVDNFFIFSFLTLTFSGFSPVAGLKSGQFDRERNFLVSEKNSKSQITI
jgi:hypothetical protein